MFIPTWILIIVIMGVGFYYFRNKKRTNSVVSKKSDPTYDEMLKLDEKEFQQWLLIRNETDREKLLVEMIDHEERTGSFKSTAKKEVSGAEQAVLDIFDKNKSARVTNFLDRLSKIVSVFGKKDEDLVQAAIFAKAASDKVGLGEKMGKERLVQK